MPADYTLAEYKRIIHQQIGAVWRTDGRITGAASYGTIHIGLIEQFFSVF